MSNKIFVGRRCSTVSKPPTLDPISKVVVWVDDSNCYMAGDSSGRELEVTCPYATQSMANDLLSRLSGYAYRPMTAEDTLLDGVAELGDAVTVDGCYTLLASVDWTFDRLLTCDIAASGAAELEQEYIYSSTEQLFSRKIAQTRSLITKTSEQIRLEVSNEIQQLESSINIQLSEIRLEVKNDLEQLSSSIQLSLDNITLKVENNAQGLSQTVRLAADGMTITNASGSTLTIDGGQIKAASIETSAFKANSITADKLNITGAISFGDLDNNTQNTIIGTQSTASAAYNNAITANNNANNASVLANSAYNLALNNTLPSYIKSTYIDSTSIQSPTIMGGRFIGNEFNVTSEYGDGSFNLYGNYGTKTLHALQIAYNDSSGTPYTTFSSPLSGCYARWSFPRTELYGNCSVGRGYSFSFYGSSGWTTLEELEKRVAALGG